MEECLFLKGVDNMIEEDGLIVTSDDVFCG